ncbi:MAG: preprotein translocase subunit YajC [Bacteroidales bacterium]|jgi:preprotein translocase subunit YajC|nr:preprotein translocase subunit YajC [Bacteroidales bacterium]
MNWFYLLQDTAAPATQGGGGMMWIMLLLIIVVFYFFMIRPQQKKQKQMQSYRDTLQKGDKVVTIGGVHGKIDGVKDTSFLLEIADGVKIEIDKAAIAVGATDMKKKKEA